MKSDIEKIKEAFKSCWSKETCYPKLQSMWTKDKPELGQCAVTALIIQDVFGGEIVKDDTNHHYWNVLPNGMHIDLTKEQFKKGTLFPKPYKVYRETILSQENEIKYRTKYRYELLKETLKKYFKEQ